MSIQTQRMLWKKRDALRISNDRMQAVVLAGGGHIAELRLLNEGDASVNLLWEAPWETADPGSMERSRLNALYGGMPAGPFLAGFTGHALCLDTFGLPSLEEERAGIPLHGEASVRMWEIAEAADGCRMQSYLPRSQLQISRSLRFARDERLLFVEESLENRSGSARDVHWVQHVSLGPPLLSADSSSILASVDDCRSWPSGYEGCEAITEVEFTWPYAPALNCGTLDLRIPFQQEGKGFVVAARVVPTERIAYIAAMNHSLGIALIYCFRREDFPWIAIWEENQARKGPPWNGIARVRGMEFGTTPMPLGKSAIHKMGTLFNAPVSRILPSHSSHTARYAVCISKIPDMQSVVTSIHISRDGLMLLGADQEQTMLIPGSELEEFLLEERK